MRCPYLVLPCLLLVIPVRLPSQGPAPQALPPILTAGLDLLVQNHPDSAFAFWASQWSTPNEADGFRDQMTQAFHQLPTEMTRRGAFGYELIRAVEITPHLRRVYVLVRYPLGPLYFMFELYQASDHWVIHVLNWHTDPDHVLPPTLFGVEHPER